MRIPCAVWPSLLAVALLSTAAAQEGGSSPAEPPRPSGLVEQTGRRLVQLDVSINGPADVVAALGRQDFELAVGGRTIDEFVVDRLCSPAAGTAREPAATETEAPRAAPALARVTYLFFFDQQHLTLAGRVRALEMSRELIPKLVAGGNRGMVVSSGEELRTFSELTQDPVELLAALDRLENDRKQWNIHSLEEEQNVREVLDILEDGDIDRAISAARGHQREERWRTDRALRRFSMVLGRLADLEPPKAVVYFADTMRSNAGEHYLSFFGSLKRETDAALSAMEQDSFSAGNVFDKVLEEATTNGIRIYAIQAEGLVTDSLALSAPTRLSGQDPLPYRRRLADAQNSLVGLARETGGQPFLNGVGVAKVAERIEQDLRCVYLISFEAEGLPLDQPLPVLVRVRRAKVQPQVRGRIVIQSESARLTSRLLAAFTAPDVVKSVLPVHGVVIPTGFRDDRYTALVQVSAGFSPLPGTTWDMGLSLVAQGKVSEEASGRVTVSGPGVPVVFEVEVSFKPGPYEIVAVAHETTSNRIATSVLAGTWADPDDTTASVGPIAVLQPTAGAFLRESDLRRSGALGLGEGQRARTDRTTAFVGLVCRAKSRKGRLRVERRLIGDSTAEFEPLELDLAEERCAQVRDFVPAKTMTPGAFKYEIRVLDQEEELASSVRDFAADSPEEPHAPPSS